MRYLGQDAFTGHGATVGAYVRRPAAARSAAVYTEPPVCDLFPPLDGAGEHAHVIVTFSDAMQDEAETGSPYRLARHDLAVDQRQPFPLPECVALVVRDGGATGSTAIARGVVVWFGED